MNLYSNNLYLEDLDYVVGLDVLWKKLRNKRILISGASGLVGSFLIDVLLRKNEKDHLNCTVYAIVRNVERCVKRFSRWGNNSLLHFIHHDVNYPIVDFYVDNVDYVLHMASNTHPILYSKDPIGTITTNIIGLKNMLDFAVNHNTKRFVFLSSNEIYGENRGDTELFDENYCGYINCNTIRAGYPESKRCGEALCQAYKSQKGLDVVIPRLTRSYGPTMLFSDKKAISQFILNAVSGEDIKLKSAGNQYYSYTYVADAVSGVLYVLLNGMNGESYNIADESSDILLRDLASLIAGIVGKSVVYEIPSAVELLGYSTATIARLNGKKISSLGWTAKYNISRGVERTIKILRSITKGNVID